MNKLKEQFESQQ